MDNGRWVSAKIEILQHLPVLRYPLTLTNI
jgi:hypothetical protein